MKTAIANTSAASFGAFAATRISKYMPQIAFEGEGGGSGGGDDEAAKKAAADAAAKEAAEKAAAEKAEADKKAAEEAARKADLEKSVEDLAKEKHDLLKEVMDKKAKQKAADERATLLESELKKFEGIDPDAVRALIAEKAEAEKIEAEKRGEFERVKQMMVEDHQKQMKALEDQLAGIQTTISAKDKTIDDLTIGVQFSSSKFVADDMVLAPVKARALYGSHFEIKDGKLVAYDKPAGSGERTPLVDAAGNPLSFDAAMAKIVEADPDKETLLKSKMTPGGSSSTTQVQQPVTQKKPEGLTGARRIAAALAKEGK